MERTERRERRQKSRPKWAAPRAPTLVLSFFLFIRALGSFVSFISVLWVICVLFVLPADRPYRIALSDPVQRADVAHYSPEHGVGTIEVRLRCQSDEPLACARV